MNLTRERIRQVEVKALAKLEALKDMMNLREYVDEGPVGKRRLPRLSKADLAGIDAEEDLGDDSDIEDDDEAVVPIENVEKGPKKAELEVLDA